MDKTENEIKYKIDHFSITVTDLEKSVAFYRDNFGFQEIKRANKPNLELKLALLKLEDSCLEIIEPYKKKETPKLSGLKSLSESLQESQFHLAISVDKLFAAYLKVQENKIKHINSNRSFFFCEDPDGYLVEIRQGK